MGAPAPRRPGLTAEAVREFCAGQLAHYRFPRYVHVVDKFPMTVTGKVRKVEMRERAVEILLAADALRPDGHNRHDRISRRHASVSPYMRRKGSPWSCMVMIAKFGAEEIEK